MPEAEAFLARILIFPVKSLDALEQVHARILPSGALEHDRKWGLFDADGKFVNGKRQAAVHRLRSHVDLDAGVLTLHDDSGKNRGSRTFAPDRELAALEGWLHDYFHFPVAFRSNMEMGFPDDTDSPGPTVISTATLAEIGMWFGLPMAEVRARFRANIEIDGVPPFWEDRLFGAPGTVVKFRIGAAVFEGVNPCQRCVVPPRHPQTGVLDDTFVRRFTELRSRTLPAWSTRERFNHYYRVAINTRPHGDQGGKVLRVGDHVEILDVPVRTGWVPAIADNAVPTPDFWTGELVVGAVRDETPSVKTFCLRHPAEQALPFRFLAGQFLTLTFTEGAKSVQRCYTIASSPSQRDHCEITVKREGIASGLLHDCLASGSRVVVSGPLGRFTFDEKAAQEIVMIAGGVGITPLMSKIRFLVGQKWDGKIDLIYSAKTERDIIFREELDALRRIVPALKIHMTITADDADWKGGRGRLSADFIRTAVPDIAERRVHLCGPTAMAASVQHILRQLGVEPSRIDVEAFGGKAAIVPASDAARHDVRFVRSGITTRVSEHTTILDAALAAGLAVDHGCRAGVCGRCKAKLLDGEVTLDCDFVLTPEQKAAGLILTCQAHPLSAVIVDC